MQPEPNPSSGHVRFGEFELDLSSHELLRAGHRVRLQEKSFLVLHQLLRSPGRVVTRDELVAALWSKEQFVDAEHGLNTAVRRLREALGDSATAARYVETLPKVGYRFIGTIDPIHCATDDVPGGVEVQLGDSSISPASSLIATSSTETQSPTPPKPASSELPGAWWRPLRRGPIALAAALGTVLVAVVMMLATRPPSSREELHPDVPAAAAAAAPATASERDAEAVRELLARAHYLRNMKRYADARRFVDEALRLDPRNGKAFGLLAIMQLSDGANDEARETAQRALELDPNSADAYTALANIAERSDDFATAEHYHRRAVAADPTNGKAHNRLGRLLLSMGRTDDAREQILASRRLDPDNPDVQNIWIDYYLRTGDYERATRAGESWLEVWAEDPYQRAVTRAVRDQLGLAYVGARRFDDALAQFRTNDPDDDLRVSLVRGYEGRIDEARSILENHEQVVATGAAVEPVAPAHHEALAMAYIATRDFDRAFDHLDRAVAGRLYPSWLNAPLFHAIRVDPRWPAFETKLALEFFGARPKPMKPILFPGWPPRREGQSPTGG